MRVFCLFLAYQYVQYPIFFFFFLGGGGKDDGVSAPTRWFVEAKKSLPVGGQKLGSTKQYTGLIKCLWIFEIQGDMVFARKLLSLA